MSDNDDRRTIDRVPIPRGSVFYKPEAQMTILNRYSGPEVLVDISKGGAGFIVSHDLNKNDRIRVKFQLPGEETIILHGHVKWVSSEDILGKNRVGMQFSPFGDQGKYNAHHKLELLGQIGEKFIDIQ